MMLPDSLSSIPQAFDPKLSKNPIFHVFRTPLNPKPLNPKPINPKPIV